MQLKGMLLRTIIERIYTSFFTLARAFGFHLFFTLVVLNFLLCSNCSYVHVPSLIFALRNVYMIFFVFFLQNV